MQYFEGKVVGVKSAKTVAVEVPYVYRHPKYKKIVKRTTKLLVHNEILEVAVGDRVRIEKSRPYSKLKHFKVISKI